MVEAATHALEFRMVGETPVWERRLDGGRWLSAHPLLFGRGLVLLGEGSPRLHGDTWEFPSWPVAFKALLNWDGRGEPEGWDRHPATHRRRLQPT